MKSKELREVLESETMSIEDKLGKIMAMNGVDVNHAKETATEDNTKLQQSNESLSKELEALKSQLSGYSDYEELKKYKADAVAKEESDKKLNFLKAQGCKHPELIVDKVDFTKGEYNEESKTYTGLDEVVKGIKDSYIDLFAKSEPQGITPQSNGNTVTELSGVEKAFYGLNPALKK